MSSVLARLGRLPMPARTRARRGWAFNSVRMSIVPCARHFFAIWSSAWMPVASMAGTLRMRRMKNFGGLAISPQDVLDLVGGAEEEGAVDLVDLYAGRELEPTHEALAAA